VFLKSSLTAVLQSAGESDCRWEYAVRAETVAEPMGRTKDDRLAFEQLRLALANLKPNCWLMPVMSAIVCAMFARWVALPVLLTWFAVVTLGGAPLGIVAFGFPTHLHRRLTTHQRVAAATISYFVFTICWSSFGLFFWRAGDDLNHMLIMLILACTLAGNSALVGACRPLTLNGYAVYGLGLVALPLREGGVIYDGLAILAFLYVCYLAYMSRQIFATARDMLLLRDDKSDLIEALAKSKMDSDAARMRAEAASRAKSEFLANMSHELRTPLNAIIGFAEIIHGNVLGSNPERHIEYSKLIGQSGHHLLELINDILDLAKIEAGGFELRETNVDLTRLIDDCVEMMRPKLQDGTIDLSTEVAADLPVVIGDERALRQVLLNLLSNAVKFTPAGGGITVFGQATDAGDIAFGVHDTGLGISVEDQDRVFQSFGQGRHDVVTADKGTGLGLPIVKGLAEAHGGSVELASWPGRGTRVTIILPAARAYSGQRKAS
jgi:two-component system cell cycle sensor histidine kinase PleC